MSVLRRRSLRFVWLAFLAYFAVAVAVFRSRGNSGGSELAPGEQFSSQDATGRTAAIALYCVLTNLPDFASMAIYAAIIRGRRQGKVAVAQAAVPEPNEVPAQNVPMSLFFI